MRRRASKESGREPEAWRAPIITGRLIIREAVATDWSSMTSTIDEQVRRGSGLSEQSLRHLSGAAEFATIRSATRMICTKPSGQVVGGIVTETGDDVNAPFLWMWIGPAGRDLGYEREVLVAIVDHLHEFGAVEVRVQVRPGSTDYLETVESAGFHRSGQETITTLDGEPLEVVNFVHTRSASPPQARVDD